MARTYPPTNTATFANRPHTIATSSPDPTACSIPGSFRAPLPQVRSLAAMPQHRASPGTPAGHRDCHLPVSQPVLGFGKPALKVGRTYGRPQIVATVARFRRGTSFVAQFDIATACASRRAGESGLMPIARESASFPRPRNPRSPLGRCQAARMNLNRADVRCLFRTSTNHLALNAAAAIRAASGLSVLRGSGTQSGRLRRLCNKSQSARRDRRLTITCPDRQRS